MAALPDAAREGRRWLSPLGRHRLSPLVADALLALILSALAAAESLAGTSSSTFGQTDAGTPFVLLMTIPLIWRRRQPLLVFGLIAASAVFTFTQAPYIGVVAVMVATYSVGAYSRRRFLSVGVVFVTVTIIVVAFHGSLPPLPSAAGPYAISLPLWLAGAAIRNRQLRADLFEDRATRLEREREQATRAAIAEERARIARELHDVVAHSVSVMVVQAGAARHVLPAAPDQAREALLAVEASGREAMAELRRLLGVLDRDGDEVAVAPQPGIEQMESLLRRIGEAGLPVTLHVEGKARPLPPGVNLTVYRIVQEALTNALKYSGGARTDVVLDYREGELKVKILDDGSGDHGRHGDGTGHGLVGMREARRPVRRDAGSGAAAGAGLRRARLAPISVGRRGIACSEPYPLGPPASCRPAMPTGSRRSQEKRRAQTSLQLR